MKLYTKTGDRGETSLYSGQRLTKGHVIFEALGGLDELSAHLGECRVHYQTLKTNESDLANARIIEIQSRLLDIGSIIANHSNVVDSGWVFEEEHTLSIERWIDEYESVNTTLRNFLISGCLPNSVNMGSRTWLLSQVSAKMHVARAVCRRVERVVVALFQNPNMHVGGTEVEVLKYLNRLSDLFFTMARNAVNGQEETAYSPVRGLISRRASNIVSVRGNEGNDTSGTNGSRFRRTLTKFMTLVNPILVVLARGS